MKTVKVLLIVFLGLSLFKWVFSIEIQEKGKEEQKMMEVWMKYATPSDGHKFLQKHTGNWEITSKMWEKPGQEPQITTGSAIGEMILGGRYLKISYKGEMMGMPFEGISIYGYDNHLHKYQSTWIDNMGTGIMFSTGTVDKSGMILTQYAELDNIFTGQKEKAKNVTTFISADKFKIEMYMIGSNGEFKSLEIIHLSKK